jgi:hypothetical protein
MAKRFGLADVLRLAGPAYLQTHTLSAAQAKAWRAILACRTEALGGHIERCDACGAVRHLYHSCRNRHCPLCQTRAKEAWLIARRRELLPVPYFHLVFTLPHVLNALVGRHPRAMYDMLFGAASATLSEFAANPRWLGGTAAFTLMLHTWKQDLGRHVHVHALVAGGALDQQGQWRWPARGFLFPVKALSRVFRGKFMALLGIARSASRLQGDCALQGAPWSALAAQLRRHDWVVYAKRPLGGAAQVLEYLGRYTHRVAISNERLVQVGPEQVRLRVRDASQSKGGRVITLPTQEFIARYLRHVLPTGYKRIRHYGLLAPRNKATSLAAARRALEMPAPDAVAIETVAEFMLRVAKVEWNTCPHCRRGRFAYLEPIPVHHLPDILTRGPP